MTNEELSVLIKENQSYMNGKWWLNASWILTNNIDIEDLKKRGWEFSPSEDAMYYDRGF